MEAFDSVSISHTKMPGLVRESLLMLLLADVYAVIYKGSGTLAEN
jgi:hypothetical protein